MASSSASTSERNRIDLDPELVEQFVAITGANRDVAVNMLEACSGNLELAVGMHMDGSTAVDGPSQSSSTSAGLPSSADLQDSEDTVRAPIPQKTEVLMEQDLSKLAWRMKRPRRHAASVFDGFRDFQAETNHYEELSRGKRPSKKRNLEDLFRPPVDITMKGTFQNARDAGSAQNKWLLVNMQNVQEFPCQMLNRDVWSSPDVRNVIKDSFIFWQVYNDSEEGRRYMQFYKLKQWPYIAIIDPFTGENQIEWHKVPDGNVFCELAKDFLSSFPVPDQSQLPSAAKKQKREPSIVDATEDEQMEAAIQASLSSTKPSSPQYVLDSDSEADVIGDSDGELETFSDEDDVIVASEPISKATNGKHQDSLSSSGSSKTPLKSSASSLSNRDHVITDGLKSQIPSRVIPLAFSSSTSSLSQQSSSSSSSTQPSKPGLSRKPQGSEVRISHRDLLEAGSSNSNSSSSALLPTDSSIWAASNPARDTDSPLSVNNDDLLMDMIGGRDSEVGTPEVVDSSSNSQSPVHGGASAAGDPPASSSWTDFWGNPQDPKSRIMLRFPDNKREQIELPCSSSLKALTTLCSSRGFPADKFELVTNFPRKQLSKLDQDTTVKEAGLHPQDTIFVQDL